MAPARDKPIEWIGSAMEDLRAFPASARRRAGFDLRAVQAGLQPSDFKPMNAIGSGAYELRVRSEAGTVHRVFYIAKFKEAVYVLHAFEKKTQKTSSADIEQGRQRYREVLAYRKAQRKDGSK